MLAGNWADTMDLEQQKHAEPGLVQSARDLDATRGLVEHGSRNTERRATFGFYDEGSGVYSLYLAPVDARTVTRALLPHTRGQQLLASTPLTGPAGTVPLKIEGWSGAGHHLLGLRAPVEALVIDPSVVDAGSMERMLPASLLGNPEASLPEGALFALCMLDNRHAVVLSREKSILSTALEALIVSLETAFGIHEPPHISTEAMESLLQPLDPWSWWEIECGNHKRFHTLDLNAMDGLGEDDTSDTGMRWVAPKGGGWWRFGWNW
jgi:hypothetical protein